MLLLVSEPIMYQMGWDSVTVATKTMEEWQRARDTKTHLWEQIGQTLNVAGECCMVEKLYLL